jgi:hypothetical protein
MTREERTVLTGGTRNRRTQAGMTARAASLSYAVYLTSTTLIYWRIRGMDEIDGIDVEFKATTDPPLRWEGG